MEKRNNAIDILKFLFSLLILIYHAIYVISPDSVKIYPGGGYIGVEFFFVVSGFLMAHSAFKTAERKNGSLCLGEETVAFLRRKIGTLFPYFAFAYIVSATVQIIIYQITGKILIKNLVYSVWEILLLHQSGINVFRWVQGDWYISAMLIGMLFIYPFLRRYLRTYSYIAAPCVVILYMGYFSKKYGYLHVTGNWNGFVYDSLIRAFGGMNLGIIVYAVAERLRNISFTRLGRRLLSVCACTGYVSIFVTVFLRSKGAIDFIWLLCIAGSFAITGSGAGSLCRRLNALDSKSFVFLGKYSMALYMNHLTCQHIVKRWFSLWSVEKRIILFCIMGLILAWVCVFCVEYTKIFWDKYKGHVRRVLLEESR